MCGGVCLCACVCERCSTTFGGIRRPFLSVCIDASGAMSVGHDELCKQQELEHKASRPREATCTASTSMAANVAVLLIRVTLQALMEWTDVCVALHFRVRA